MDFGAYRPSRHHTAGVIFSQHQIFPRPYIEAGVFTYCESFAPSYGPLELVGGFSTHFLTFSSPGSGEGLV